MTRTKKPTSEQSKAPIQFDKDNEYKLTEMQSSFVWHYTEGACGMTEAARKAGYEFPSASADKLLNGKDYPNVTKAIRIRQEELREKYSITPEKTGTMLWKLAETSFESGHFNAAVSAIKELNQLAGLSINRSQNLNINANVDAMNRDDIKERLGKLLGVDTDISQKDF